MRVTPDRLAVARAVAEMIIETDLLSPRREEQVRRVIEAIPELPDDSPSSQSLAA